MNGATMFYSGAMSAVLPLLGFHGYLTFAYAARNVQADGAEDLWRNSSTTHVDLHLIHQKDRVRPVGEINS